MIPISLLACRDNCLAASNITMAGLNVPRCSCLNDIVRCLLPNRIGPSTCVPFAFYVRCWSMQPTCCLHFRDKLSPEHRSVDRILFARHYCLLSRRLRPVAQPGSTPKPLCCSPYAHLSVRQLEKPLFREDWPGVLGILYLPWDCTSPFTSPFKYYCPGIESLSYLLNLSAT